MRFGVFRHVLHGNAKLLLGFDVLVGFHVQSPQLQRGLSVIGTSLQSFLKFLRGFVILAFFRKHSSQLHAGITVLRIGRQQLAQRSFGLGILLLLDIDVGQCGNGLL